MLKMIYTMLSGYMRITYFLMVLIAYLIPAGFTSLHGHGRNGRHTVAQVLELNNPWMVVFWLVSITWFFWPILVSFYHAYKTPANPNNHNI